MYWTFQAFTPMAECARSIIAANGFKDKIKVVPKRSTELKVGKGNKPCAWFVISVHSSIHQSRS